jgi:hypothetical protein
LWLFRSVPVPVPVPLCPCPPRALSRDACICTRALAACVPRSPDDRPLHWRASTRARGEVGSQAVLCGPVLLRSIFPQRKPPGCDHHGREILYIGGRLERYVRRLDPRRKRGFRHIRVPTRRDCHWHRHWDLDGAAS